MATLHLVKTDAGAYFLQGTGDPSRNADFSLFDVDGEGGDPFGLASGSKWQIVDGIVGVDYDPNDTDTFWAAQQEILKAAKVAGISL
jgi:hypothetical protein